ncbi:hypothetical protein BSL78_05334 [Apostichopus japonicus]|uniref:Uncharacterized protein n=1 Tax=Stichopus japonicus TaxID=307972 RepID=A0A2G8LBT8_STIJA|nr:hypothetical protein BSL78_05334 [Apostichopus japonicus]
MSDNVDSGKGDTGKMTATTSKDDKEKVTKSDKGEPTSTSLTKVSQKKEKNAKESKPPPSKKGSKKKKKKKSLEKKKDSAASPSQMIVNEDNHEIDSSESKSSVSRKKHKKEKQEDSEDVKTLKAKNRLPSTSPDRKDQDKRSSRKEEKHLKSSVTDNEDVDENSEVRKQKLSPEISKQNDSPELKEPLPEVDSKIKTNKRKSRKSSDTPSRREQSPVATKHKESFKEKQHSAKSPSRSLSPKGKKSRKQDDEDRKQDLQYSSAEEKKSSSRKRRKGDSHSSVDHLDDSLDKLETKEKEKEVQKKEINSSKKTSKTESQGKTSKEVVGKHNEVINKSQSEKLPKGTDLNINLEEKSEVLSRGHAKKLEQHKGNVGKPLEVLREQDIKAALENRFGKWADLDPLESQEEGFTPGNKGVSSDVNINVVQLPSNAVSENEHRLLANHPPVQRMDSVHKKGSVDSRNHSSSKTETSDLNNKRGRKVSSRSSRWEDRNDKSERKLSSVGSSTFEDQKNSSDATSRSAELEESALRLLADDYYSSSGSPEKDDRRQRRGKGSRKETFHKTKRCSETIEDGSIDGSRNRKDTRERRSDSEESLDAKRHAKRTPEKRSSKMKSDSRKKSKQSCKEEEIKERHESESDSSEDEGNFNQGKTRMRKLSTSKTSKGASKHEKGEKSGYKSHEGKNRTLTDCVEFSDCHLQEHFHRDYCHLVKTPVLRLRGGCESQFSRSADSGSSSSSSSESASEISETETAKLHQPQQNIKHMENVSDNIPVQQVDPQGETAAMLSTPSSDDSQSSKSSSSSGSSQSSSNSSSSSDSDESLSKSSEKSTSRTGEAKGRQKRKRPSSTSSSSNSERFSSRKETGEESSSDSSGNVDAYSLFDSWEDYMDSKAIHNSKEDEDQKVVDKEMKYTKAKIPPSDHTDNYEREIGRDENKTAGEEIPSHKKDSKELLLKSVVNNQVSYEAPVQQRNQTNQVSASSEMNAVRKLGNERDSKTIGNLCEKNIGSTSQMREEQRYRNRQTVYREPWRHGGRDYRRTASDGEWDRYRGVIQVKESNPFFYLKQRDKEEMLDLIYQDKVKELPPNKSRSWWCL